MWTSRMKNQETWTIKEFMEKKEKTIKPKTNPIQLNSIALGVINPFSLPGSEYILLGGVVVIIIGGIALQKYLAIYGLDEWFNTILKLTFTFLAYGSIIWLLLYASKIFI